MVKQNNIGAFGALLLLTGCAGEPQVMVLSQICSNQYYFNGTSCVVSGDAQFVDGIADGSTGCKIGPSGGQLRVALSAVGAIYQGSWSLDVLAGANIPEGSLITIAVDWGASDPTLVNPSPSQAPLTEDYAWVIAVEGAIGVSSSSGSDGVIIFSGANLDIADIRTPGFDQKYY